MSRGLAVVAMLLSVLGCGGNSADQAPSYAYAFTISMCSCGSQHVSHCIDQPAAGTHPASSLTCTEGRNGFGELVRGWAYLESPCPYPDCRMVTYLPDVGICAAQIECVARF